MSPTLSIRTIAACAAALFSLVAPSRAERVDFAKQVLPILQERCFKCHSGEAKKPKGDIRLDELEAIRAKSKTDNLVFPHKPDKSLLFEVIDLPEGSDGIMPPADEGKPLTKDQVALIKRWIDEGAAFGDWKRADQRPRVIATKDEFPDGRDVAGIARRIDQLIEAALAAKGAKPNPPASEGVWMRRVYLDLIGRIPTYQEANEFLRSKDPAKRTKLIDRLLASNGHVSTMFNYFCDVLRARDELNDDITGDFYLAWIKECLKANKPYDVWVRDLVSPAGRIWSDPAVGYYLRDNGNRFANVDATATVFLGTQIACAQCHDHPYDKWTRREYHEFAGWSAAIQRDQNDAGIGELSQSEVTMVKQKIENDMEREMDRRNPNMRRQTEANLAEKTLDGILASGGKLKNEIRAEARLPHDYQYPDGKPGEPIPLSVLFGPMPDANRVVGERASDFFSAWLTSPQNPRFSLTIANRLWQRMFGAPFAGPLDNVKDVEDCPNPDLAQYLANVMVAVKFDLRQFQRVIAHTQAYARECSVLPPGEIHHDFAGPLLRRMSAEQVWDSLMTLAVPDLDEKIEFAPPDSEIFKRAASVKSREELYSTVKSLARDAAAELRKAQRIAARQRRRSAYEAMAEYSPAGLKRASELPQPAPEGHFLRTFGQSNRDFIDGGWRQGTVPQTLMMLNSSLFDVVLKSGTPLFDNVRVAGGDSSRLRVAFLSILSREPTVDDVKALSKTISNPAGNIEMLARTLLGTRQFLFIQ